MGRGEGKGGIQAGGQSVGKATTDPGFWADGKRPADGLPQEELPFKLKDLKDAIPKHCFERSTLRSFGFVAWDVVIVSLLFYSTLFFNHEAVPDWAAYVLWPMYWWWQGAFCTGIWVIAHECGHRAFSDHIWLGDIVGLVLHSALLVPYHPWRISHAKHHKNTNSMDDDEVFVPYTLSEYGGMVPNPADECPGPVACALRITQILKMLTFGWPAYLAMHVTGKRYPQRTSHFEPSSPIFTTKDFMDVVISDIVLLAVVSGLGLIGWTHGFVWLTKVYVIPYLFVNMWLVMYTDLQHTDTRLPHYRGAAMEWMKGALCTMDRNYGIFNEIHHHIGDTHVCHHLFSYMPHYHAEEASEAIKPVLGQYYLVDNKQPGILGIAAALYETASQCRYVDDVGEVLWWKRSVPKKTE